MDLCLPNAYRTGVGPETKRYSKVGENDVPDTPILKGDATAPKGRAFLKKTAKR
jgi:hypothetical protein